MSTFTFDREARPYLTDIPISKQGVAFDRIELDAWVDDHMRANGRPPKRRTLWESQKQAFGNEAKFGGLKSKSTESAYEKARGQVISARPRDT
jgi:hypothetical protein